VRHSQVHSKGKRAFHPYSEISSEGRIDARIFTMDGDQVSGDLFACARVHVTACLLCVPVNTCTRLGTSEPWLSFTRCTFSFRLCSVVQLWVRV
jgi:hypothetical protein